MEQNNDILKTILNKITKLETDLIQLNQKINDIEPCSCAAIVRGPKTNRLVIVDLHRGFAWYNSGAYRVIRGTKDDVANILEDIDKDDIVVSMSYGLVDIWAIFADRHHGDGDDFRGDEIALDSRLDWLIAELESIKEEFYG